MLGTTKGKRITRKVDDYVLFDLETTGLSWDRDSIVEISAIKVEQGEIVDEFSTLVNPERPLSRGAMQVNHITEDMVASAPTIGEILPAFLEFVGDHILMGHNIERFDLHFLYRDCERCLGGIPDNDYVDTLMVAKACLPQTRRHGLTTLAEYYGVTSEGAHRALFDCKMNKQVYDHLVAEKQDGGLRACPKCGSILVRREGKFGAFWGCTGYPNCRYTENIRE